MEKGIVLLNVLGSIASIVGLAFVYYGTNDDTMKQVWQIAFVTTIVLSAYVLLVPGTIIEKNVSSKLRVFRTDSPDSGKMYVQEGEQVILGCGPLSVKFAIPYSSPPEVELLNTGECGDMPGWIPKIKETTRFQFVVTRPAGRMCQGDEKWYPDKFKWIAIGQVLSEVSNREAGSDPRNSDSQDIRR